jgi:uncharacterized membrane protein
MVWLLLGLVIFLGVHSVRMVAPGWREAMRIRMGQGPWMGAFSVLSALGLISIVWGLGQARLDPVVLWVPHVATRHLAALLMLISFVLLAAAYVPGNSIKARLHHPMVLAVKVWALAHLLANGRLADVLLFGAFLLWAVANFRSARQRDRTGGTVYPPGKGLATALTVILGAVAWGLFALWGHQWLIGVSPLGL